MVKYVYIWQSLLIGFEWDADKESENMRKHGFAFADAVEAFG